MKAPITFEPSGTTVWVECGTSVHDAALIAGVPLSTPCGGRGVCGACGVRVVEGVLDAPDAVEVERLVRTRPGVRLGCRATVSERVVVRPVLLLEGETSERSPLPADARSAVAVDLGTTGISAVAVDLDTGVEGPVGTVPNAQAAHGADVLSRIAASSAGEARVLREGATSSVRAAVQRALIGAAWAPESVVVAGNTAMEALLAGVDATSLGVHPFAAPEIPSLVTLDLGFTEMPMRLMPVISSFVGGDTTACLLHTGMAQSTETQLLVDLGTNAEIALAHEGSLWVASAAAGPAFEASGIECGGPAGPGSVLGVQWGPTSGWQLDIMGGGTAERLAGSGLVAAVALLRRLGHLEADGRMVSEGPLSAGIFTGEDGVLRLQVGEYGGIVLSQLDVRALQLAKAAVRVGVEFVMRAAKVTSAQIERVHVAGAFGSGLVGDDLVDIGIIPAGTAGVVSTVGNASLYGALAAAVTPSLIEDVSEAVSRAQQVELAGDATFQASLMTALELVPFDL